MEYLMLIVFIVAGISLWLWSNKLTMQEDARADYTNLYGERILLENGTLGLIFRYSKYEPRKKKYILNNFFPDVTVYTIDIETQQLDTRYEYVIVDRLATDHYFEKLNSKGEIISKEGPYIVYEIIPKSKLKQNIINNGPIQHIKNNYGNVAQNNNYKLYNQEINNYKKNMIDRGVEAEDIDILLNNPDNSQIHGDFLIKYEPILRGIEVASAGVSLFEFLLKLFGF